MPLWIVVVIGLMVSSLVGGVVVYNQPSVNIDDTVVALGRNTAGDTVGAGVIVDTHGGILTAAHVAEAFGDSPIIVTLNYDVENPLGEKTRTVVGRVVWSSSVADLAYIQVDAVTFRSEAKIASDGLDTGDAVLIIGHPHGYRWAHTAGHVAIPSVPGHPAGRYQGYWVTFLDATVAGGNSGGGVFNENGELVGILSAGFATYVEATAPISMSIPSDVICRLLLCE